SRVAVDASKFLGRDLRREARHHLARMDLFVLARDHTSIDEVDDAAGQQFGVNAEVVALVQIEAHRGGDVADTDLEGRTVGNQLVRGERADYLRRVDRLF